MSYARVSDGLYVGLHVYFWFEEGSKLPDSWCLKALYIWMCVHRLIYMFLYIHTYIIMYMYKQVCPKLVEKCKV